MSEQQKTRRGRKPKDKSVEQYSTKQIGSDDTVPKKKKGRKSNQQKSQNSELLTSLQMDSEQQMEQSDTVFRVAKTQITESGTPTVGTQGGNLVSSSLFSDITNNQMQNSSNLDLNQIDQLNTNISNLQINDPDIKQQQNNGLELNSYTQKQQLENEIQAVDNFIPQSIFQQTGISFQGSVDDSDGFNIPDLNFKPSESFVNQTQDQQFKKKKDGPADIKSTVPDFGFKQPKSLQIPSQSAYLKNQIKQGKLFQEKETDEIINLSTKNQKWPVSVKTMCCYDCHSFDTTPIGIPVEITPDNKFKMYSYCCSLNCVLALIHQNNSLDLYKQINYLMEFQRQFFNSTAHIPIAPPKELLRQFGGEFSIEQFRRTFSTLEQSLYSRFSEPFEPNEIVQQGQQLQKVMPEPQYDINKSIPTEVQSWTGGPYS